MGLAVVGDVCQATATLPESFHFREVVALVNVLTHVQSNVICSYLNTVVMAKDRKYLHLHAPVGGCCVAVTWGQKL